MDVNSSHISQVVCFQENKTVLIKAFWVTHIDSGP